MNTGKQTNLVGYFSLAIVLIGIIAVLMGKITGTEFVAILAGVGAFASVMINFITKKHSYEPDHKADSGGEIPPGGPPTGPPPGGG